MAKSGRKSVAELEQYVAMDETEFLEPPTDLPEEQWAIWRDAVRSKPPEWFRPDSIPMLEAYCQAVVNCRKLNARLKSPPDRVIDHQRLQQMANAQTQLMIQLATKMRLTQQSRFSPKKAARLDRDAEAEQPWDD